VKATRPGQSALLLVDAIEILAREKIDYLVIGAFALSVLGVVRASRDADAVLEVSIGRFRKLKAVLERAGFSASLREGDEDDPIPMMLILNDVHGNQVDLLAGLRGLDPNAFVRGMEVAFLGGVIRVVGREDFIAMKCFAAGPQHLSDAQDAFRSAESPVDVDLLRRVTRRFGRDAADRLEQVISNATR
jgi:hypothetical protein